MGKTKDAYIKKVHMSNGQVDMKADMPYLRRVGVVH